jgi:hypothetical protein
MAPSIGLARTQRGNGSNSSARWIVKPARSTAAAVSRPWWHPGSGGSMRGETVLPAGQAPATLRRPAWPQAPALAEPRTGSWPRPWAGARRAPGRSRRQPRTPLRAAGTRFMPARRPRSTPAPPRRPSTAPRHTGGRATATTGPAGNTADQPDQQHPRHPPVAERSTRRCGRVRPQQRPIRGGRRQHALQPGPQPRSPAPARPSARRPTPAPARRRAGPPGHVRRPAQHRSYPDTAGCC